MLFGSCTGALTTDPPKHPTDDSPVLIWHFGWILIHHLIYSMFENRKRIFCLCTYGLYHAMCSQVTCIKQFFFFLFSYILHLKYLVSPGIFHKDCFSEQVHILSFCILWGLSGISSALRIDQILQTSYSYWISKRNRYGISYVFYPWLR